MNLVTNWRSVLAHAWSVRLLALSIALGAIEVALPYFNGVLPVSPGTFALLVLVTNVAAAVARLVHQRKL